MDASMTSTKQYLEQTLVPVLLDGMARLNVNRPFDAVEGLFKFFMNMKVASDNIAIPFQQYLDLTVMPLLLEGIKRVAKVRPHNPIQYLAAHLREAREVIMEVVDDEVLDMAAEVIMLTDEDITDPVPAQQQ